MANKYRAQKATIDGITFDSKKEARRWQELKLLEAAGQIRDLNRQVKFDLKAYRASINHPAQPIKIRSAGFPNGRLATWTADFTYVEDGKWTVEDVKGMDTPVSRLKRAIVEAMLGIEVRIT